MVGLMIETKLETLPKMSRDGLGLNASMARFRPDLPRRQTVIMDVLLKTLLSTNPSLDLVPLPTFLFNSF